MNDGERELWLDNDEPLYLAHKASGLSRREFIRKNRDMIDDHIEKILGKREGEVRRDRKTGSTGHG
jgi:hypothetical protein